VSVVTSPATCTWPVVIKVSTATWLVGSSLSIASRMASLIWSAILSGCPSVTDSEVKSRRATCLPYSAGGKNRRSVAGAGDTDHPEPARPSLLVFSQPDSNQVPDHVGEHLLGPARDRRGAPVGREHHRLVIVGAERDAPPDPVDHQQVTSFGGELCPPVREDVVRLGSEPGNDLPRPPLAGQLAQDVRVLDQPQRLRAGAD